MSTRDIMETQSNAKHEHSSRPEAYEPTPEQQDALTRVEHGENNSPEHHRDIESIRSEVQEVAKSATHETPDSQEPVAPERRGPVSRAERDSSFTTTLAEAKQHMSRPAQVFSTVIHNRVIEKASDITASTIARPNAIAAGAVCAFVVTLGLYLVAKNIGFTLSGFETLGAFIVGWLIGIGYDFFKTMITGKKDS
jgi:hypothetical protein